MARGEPSIPRGSPVNGVQGVPALTVHDEFIVREQDAPFAEMVMYGTWPEDLPELADAPWNRSRQTKSEAPLSLLKH